jgi:hypothetical protein
VSRHADVQISGRFGSNPAVFLSRGVKKRGDHQSRFKSLCLYTNVFAEQVTGEVGDIWIVGAKHAIFAMPFIYKNAIILPR